MISREEFKIELSEMNIGELLLLNIGDDKKIPIVKINEFEFEIYEIVVKDFEIEIYEKVGCESITNSKCDFLGDDNIEGGCD